MLTRKRRGEMRRVMREAELETRSTCMRDTSRVPYSTVTRKKERENATETKAPERGVGSRVLGLHS